jgi:hypothetical protein
MTAETQYQKEMKRNETKVQKRSLSFTKGTFFRCESVNTSAFQSLGSESNGWSNIPPCNSPSREVAYQVALTMRYGDVVCGEIEY